MRRSWLVVLSCAGWIAMSAPPAAAHAQEAGDAAPDAQEAGEAAPAAAAAASDEAGASAGPSRTAAEADADAPPQETTSPAPERLRVAVVLVGDANDEARAAASRVEIAVRATLALPSDDALRASLIGGAHDALIEPVARDRRALGGTEREDLPILARLGDRADVIALLVVRSRAGRRELVVFDVRHRAFFEGAVALTAEADDARILRFARARARAAMASQALSPEATAALEARVVEPASADEAARRALAGAGEEEHEPDWIEVNWPYLVAGALLAGAAAFVIVYTTNDSEPVPMLRFRPGGAP